MLVKIGDSIGVALENISRGVHSDTQGYIEGALTSIVIAYQRGNHIVFASTDTLERILDAGKGRIAKRDWGYISRLYRERATHPRPASIQKYLEVIADGIDITKNRDGAIEVPAHIVCAFPILEKPILLVEHQDDGRFYEMIANAYRIVEKLGNFPIRAKIQGGGGSTMAAEFLAIYSNDQLALCLCIVDSDRKYPGGALGSTLKTMGEARKSLIEAYKYKAKRSRHQAHRYSRSIEYISECKELNVREAENLISISLLQRVEIRAVQPSALSYLERLDINDALRQDISRHPMRFIDMKKGLKAIELINNSNGDFVGYWQGILDKVPPHSGTKTAICWSHPQCKTKDKCTCDLVPGLGDQILRTVTEAVKDKIAVEAAHEIEDTLLHKEWDDLGKTLTEWLCGGREQFL